MLRRFDRDAHMLARASAKHHERAERLRAEVCHAAAGERPFRRLRPRLAVDTRRERAVAQSEVYDVRPLRKRARDS
jgi:hypothetical protein